MLRIHTLTPNPSVDRAFQLESLELGAVNRAEAVHVDAGGKGLNISRALKAQGIDATAVFPAGGADGRLLSELLAQAGVSRVVVPTAGDTRSNITLTHAQGVTTKINAPGPLLAPAETAALIDAVVSLVSRGDVVVAAGSLPRGIAPDFYAEVATKVAEAGGRTVLDTSGIALKAALDNAHVGAISLIKPNLEELEELVGSQLGSVGEIVQAVRVRLGGAVPLALVSLGEYGALLVRSDATGNEGVWWAGSVLPIDPVSSVGAGDMALAGFLSAVAEVAGGSADSADLLSISGLEPGHCLARAVAWGSAAVTMAGTAIPPRHVIERQRVSVVGSVEFQTRVTDLGRM